MSNVYDMSGKKKVIKTEEPGLDISYKEIMQIIIKNATEAGCKEIFTSGGVDLCPSEVFGNKIDKKKQDDDCNYNNVTCSKCWSKAIKELGIRGEK